MASVRTIGALFGTPVATTLIFSRALNGSNEVPLWDRLFALLMAATAGTLTTGLLFRPYFSLPITHYGQMEMTDILSGTIAAAIAIAAGMVAVWCLPWLHTMMHQMKNPVFMLGIGGLILGTLGVIDGPLSLFKGLDEMWQMVANRVFSTSDCFLLAVIEFATLVATVASGFRGGRISLAVFVSVALGLMLHEHVPAIPVTITISYTILGVVLVVTRDGWLSLFMIAVIIPSTTLLPLLYIVMLPAWLLLAGKPMIVVNRQKQQSPHDNA